MTHQIRQQFLEVAFTGSAEDGMDLQRHLPELFHQQLLPAIEKAFDNAFPDDRLIVIDRLEIDAGTISFDRLDKDLSETLIKELVNSIHQKGFDGPFSEATEQRDKVAIKTIPEHLAEVFIHFLKTGTLFWSFRLSDGKTLEDELTAVIHKWDNGPNANDLVRNILKMLSIKSAVKRLNHEFSVNFRKQLIHFLSPEMASNIDKIQENLLEKVSHPDTEEDFTDRLLEVAFIYLSENKPLTSSGFKLAYAGKIGQEPSLEEKFGIRHYEADNLTGQEPLSEKREITIHSEAVGESYYIDNAGLILLHPFLPSYFQTLGIVMDKQLVYPERALGLLHYLITGEITSPEYELVLPKLLCGLPVFAPVESKKQISTNELEESTALLKAVINHWSALSNTSVDGLREAFLQRRGKLSQKEDGDWLLQVESRTLDILLGQLPWSFNMIQLPWMDRLLWVDWNY